MLGLSIWLPIPSVTHFSSIHPPKHFHANAPMLTFICSSITFINLIENSFFGTPNFGLPISSVTHFSSIHPVAEKAIHTAVVDEWGEKHGWKELKTIFMWQHIHAHYRCSSTVYSNLINEIWYWLNSKLRTPDSLRNPLFMPPYSPKREPIRLVMDGWKIGRTLMEVPHAHSTCLSIIKVQFYKKK